MDPKSLNLSFKTDNSRKPFTFTDKSKKPEEGTKSGLNEVYDKKKDVL